MDKATTVDEAVRAAVLYLRYHRDNPHAIPAPAVLAGHLVALAEAVARSLGHNPDDARYVSGRVGDPHERAPGRDDLPKRDQASKNVDNDDAA